MIAFPQENMKRDNWCHISALFARDTNKAVIFRRGPSEWTQQILWDTKTDTFDYGQWIKGGLKVDKCDLSPSGTYLMYFAQKYNASDPAYTTFTAISKPPTFTAITLWPLGDSWHGGGLFITDTQIALDHPADKREADPRHPNTLFTLVEPAKMSWVEEQRMLRDGWKVLQTDKDTQIMEYDALEHGYKLIRKSNYPACSDNRQCRDKYTFSLMDTKTGNKQPLDNVSWADFDQRGRLILALYGALLAADLAEKPLQLHILVDLNSQKAPQ